MALNFDEILLELSYRVPEGYVDLTKDYQVTELSNILKENGYKDAFELAHKARVYFSYLNEDDIVKNRQTGNVYMVKKMDPSKHDKPTPAEIQKVKAANGGEIPSEKSATTNKKNTKTDKPLPKADIGVSGAEKARQKKVSKKTTPSSVDQRLDAPAVENIKKTYNTNPEFTQSGKEFPTHEARLKLLKSKGVPKIKGVEVSEDDVYKALGVKKGELKFPAKYISVIALALTHSKGKYTITDLTDAAGAGTLDSTLGELMILIGSTIEDETSRKNFYQFLRDNVEKGGKQSPITREWIDAAENSCEAFNRKLSRNCGGGFSVQGNFWDIENEAKGAGVKNYKRDKGKSTDINTLVNCTDKSGKTTQIWQQPSLKKSKDVNALNKTTNTIYALTLNRYGTPEEKSIYNKLGNEFDSYNGLDPKAQAGNLTKRDKKGNEVPLTIAERKTQINKEMSELERKYESNIPPAANPKKAAERQKKLHESLAGDKIANKEMNKFLTDWQSKSKSEKAEMAREISRKNLSQKGDAYEAELIKLFDTLSQYQIDTPEKFQYAVDTVLGLSGKEKSKFMVAVMYGVDNSNRGKETACGEYKKKLTKNSHGHASAVLNAAIKDDESKKALLEVISQTFPLKELMEGKEWAILGEKGGGINLDNTTIAQCLGATNFEDVVEKLQIVDYGSSRKEPTLVYSADNGKRNIPISKINCRPDGIMYGTTWKLEMDIHDEFADCCKLHDK